MSSQRCSLSGAPTPPSLIHLSPVHRSLLAQFVVCSNGLRLLVLGFDMIVP